MVREMFSYLDWQLNVDPSILHDFESQVHRDFAGPGPYRLSSFLALSLPLPHQRQLFHVNTFVRSPHFPPQAHPTHNPLESSRLLPHPIHARYPILFALDFHLASHSAGHAEL